MMAMGFFPERAGRPDYAVANVICDLCHGPMCTFEGHTEKECGHKARDAGWRLLNRPARDGRIAGPCCPP